MRKLIPAIVMTMPLISSGCFGKHELPEDIVGIVGTREEIIQSYILPTAHLNDSQSPLESVVVYLAQKENGDEPIAGFEVKTLKDGTCRIPLKGLPPSTSSDGNYHPGSYDNHPNNGSEKVRGIE